MYTPSPIYLAGLAYSVGTRRSLDTLREHIDENLFQTFHVQGLKNYRECNTSASNLAAESFSRTLQLWPGTSQEIDCILFCSETSDMSEKGGAPFLEFCMNAGLENTPIIGMGMNSCGNLISALRFARNEVHSGNCRNVAVIAADCANGRSRVAHLQLGILSDGASSFIVSKDSTDAEIELLGLGHSANLNMLTLDWPADKAKAIQMVVKGVRQAFEQAIRNTAGEIASVDILLSANTRLDSMEFLSRIIRPGDHSTYRDAIASFSHVYSSDFVINMIESRAWRSKVSGKSSHVLLGLLLGAHAWGVLIGRTINQDNPAACKQQQYTSVKSN